MLVAVVELERGPPRRGVDSCWLYEPDEVVGSCLIVGDVEEERVTGGPGWLLSCRRLVGQQLVEMTQLP